MVVPGPADAAHVVWLSAARSHRGMRRRRNEDAVLDAAQRGILAVADGMGGHAAGNVASRIAIDTLLAAFPVAGANPPPATVPNPVLLPTPALMPVPAPPPTASAPELAARLAAAFHAVNEAILQHAALQPDCAGMGTTMTALAPLGGEPRCVLAHVGDSRAYRLRAGALVQLTRDHTWVQRQVDEGTLTPAQARGHPMSSVLSRVLGTLDVGAPDTMIVDVAPGDLYLLCSDGLTNMLHDAAMAAILAGAASLDDAAEQLVAAANTRGGHDNITVLLVRPEPA
jgi:serine/threonine protein phosphatase PrpC